MNCYSVWIEMPDEGFRLYIGPSKKLAEEVRDAALQNVASPASIYYGGKVELRTIERRANATD